MISKEELKKLAGLARLSIPESELDSLGKDIQGVLGYVGEIEKISAETKAEIPEHRNILRDDAEPHLGGEYTGKILGSAPETDKGFIKVKNIF